MNEPKLEKAMNTLDYLSHDDEARRMYEARQKYLHDEASRMDWATERGKEEGRQEGRKEGRQEGRQEGEAAGRRHKALEIAGNMVDMNIDTDVIVKASGLSSQEVEALQRNRVAGAE